MPMQPPRHNPGKPREAWQRRTPQKRVRGRAGMKRRLRVYTRQQGLCSRCGEVMGGRYEVDHTVPLAEGGKDVDSNCTAMHEACHEAKTAYDRSQRRTIKG